MSSDLSRMVQCQGEEANVLHFSEQELNEVLGMMETRGGQWMCYNEGGVFCTSAPSLSTNHFDNGMVLSQLEHASQHLQFQPHSPGCGSVSEAHPTSMENTSSVENNSMALGLESYCAPSTCDQYAHVEHILRAPPAAANNAGASATNAGAAASAPHQATGFTGFPPPLLPPVQPTMPPQQQQPISSSVRSSGAVEKSASHSSVEKQRRDRINSLIDELRDIVPPQKSTPPAPGVAGPRVSDGASAEARRPKHVVLADTIALLKAWRLNCQLSGNAQCSPFAPAPPASAGAAAAAAVAAVSIKDEPPPAAPARAAKQEEAPPLMPVIPMSITSRAGVTVENAKAETGVMYVQVKCRDRRGLLSDIINSLKALPLEIRTAAVVTSGDGTVRDVFEVRVDDPELTADAVQNVVHDGLYHQMSGRSDDGCGKRLKA